MADDSDESKPKAAPKEKKAGKKAAASTEAATKAIKESKETKETKATKTGKTTKEAKAPKAAKDIKDTKDTAASAKVEIRRRRLRMSRERNVKRYCINVVLYFFIIIRNCVTSRRERPMQTSPKSPRRKKPKPRRLPSRMKG